jgi:Chlorophyll A-B binding protein
MGFFDPLGFANGKSDATMAYYRESELKHGRVAMAACLGWYITASGVHPAFNSELSSNPLEAASQLAPVGWMQFVLGCGAIEWMAEKIKERPGYVPGDLLGAAYWVDNSDEGWVDYQNKEINNGRLAMVAIMGIITQDTLYGDYGGKFQFESLWTFFSADLCLTYSSFPFHSFRHDLQALNTFLLEA